MASGRSAGVRLGFVGAGTITTAIIEGLARREPLPECVLVSPRNEEVSRALAARHGFVQVARDNQGVLDGSDLVVLAVRPQVAPPILADLAFRPDHLVVSLMATVCLSDAAALVRPARRVIRAVPLPPVSEGLGATAIHPPDHEVASLFDRLGRSVAIGSEAELEALLTVSALMGSYFGIVGTVVDWLARREVPRDVASTYVGQLLYGLGSVARMEAPRPANELRREFSTSGGINEQMHSVLSANGFYAVLERGLDAVHVRLKQTQCAHGDRPGRGSADRVSTSSQVT